MRRWGLLLLACSVVAAVGSETLIEEMPSQPTTTATQFPTTGGVPTTTPVVVPVPVPSPETGTPTTPVATPTPTPTSSGTPPPSSGGTVARVGAKVFFVECNGQIVPNSEYASSAEVGCRVHLDATAKDAQNNPASPRGSPSWDYSDLGLVNVSNKSGDYTPTLTVLAPGSFVAACTVDGVRSNDVRIRFY